MTKKQYKAIAEIIKNELLQNNGDLFDKNIAVNKAVNNIKIKLADFFHKDNSRFNKKRFFQAIEI
jgi:hypothetical protein